MRAALTAAVVGLMGCLGFDPAAGYGGDDPYVEQQDQAVSGFTEKSGSRLQRMGWKCADGAQSATPLRDSRTGSTCVFQQYGGSGPYYCTSIGGPGPNPSSDVRCDLTVIP